MIDEIAKLIVEQKNVVALTGAGISVESGIPPFRGKGGIWEKYDPEEYGHIDTFKRNPKRAWTLFKEMLDCTLRAEPNHAHLALARMEENGLLNCTITQNIDGLHHKAGSKKVVEFHGNNRFLVCLKCGNRYEAKKYLDGIPPTCDCEQILKPDFILYGELIPNATIERSVEEVSECKVLLVIGTTNLVYPAASLASVAMSFGATIVEVNVAETALTQDADYFLEGKAGEVLSELLERIEACL
jgi:NAD-dependent deacetylase